MAESILTSITMAGGALNIYYDTILESKSGNGTAYNNLPSGWKVCIITSYSYDNISLVFPFAVFNASFNTADLPGNASWARISAVTFSYLHLLKK